MTALRQALDENVTFSRSFRYVLFVTAQGQSESTGKQKGPGG